MGFRKDAWATVWSVEPKTDTITSVRISTSRKIKGTDKYEQDFSGFISCVGTMAAKKAACLKEGDRIQLGDVEVTSKYDKDKKVSYNNFKCYSFNVSEETHADTVEEPDMQHDVDSGDVSDDRLPF